MTLGKPTLGNRSICVNPSIAEERPILADFVYQFGIALRHQHFFFIGRGLAYYPAKRIGDKRRAPEFKASVSRPLKPRPVDRRNVNSVCDGVRALNGSPGVQLSCAPLRLLGWM